MHQYLETVDLVKRLGVHKGDRTGTGTQSHFGLQKRYSLRNNRLPTVTTKKIHLHSVIHELFWMLSGNTRVDYLIRNNVRIWNEWVKPETAEYADLTVEEIAAKVNKALGGETWVLAFTSDTVPNRYRVMTVDDYVTENNLDLELFLLEYPNKEPGTIQKVLLVNVVDWKETETDDYRIDPASDFDLECKTRIYRLMFNEEPRKLIGGDLGPVYGKTWRNIDDVRIIPKLEWADYETRGFEFVVDIPGTSMDTDQCVVRRRIDQIQDLLEQLRDSPDSRRLMTCAWNPALVDEQALPPCHTLFQFWTRELTLEERYDWVQQNDAEAQLTFLKDTQSETGHALWDKLGVPKRAISCQLYCRSQDLFLGTPFNITFYSLLTHMLANQFNLVAEELIWVGGDCHIYSNHQEQTDLQLTREPLKGPTVTFKPEAVGKDIRAITADDFTINNYEFHQHIAGKVAV